LTTQLSLLDVYEKQSVHGALNCCTSAPLLLENDEDWVNLEIVEGWSHGFLQMSAILPEARGAMDRIADWIDEAFVRHRPSPSASGAMPSDATLAGVYAADLGGLGIASSETETEAEEGLTLVPRKRRSPPPSSRRTSESGHATGSDSTLGPATPPTPAVGAAVDGFGGTKEMMRRRMQDVVIGLADSHD